MNTIKAITIFAVIITSSLTAQSNSVYSRLGTGTPEYASNARKAGMGDLGVSLIERDLVSQLNPASYGYLDLTRINFDMTMDATFNKSGSLSKFYSGAYFNGLSLGFPVSSKYGIGVAMGMNRYTRIGYEIEQKSSNPTDSAGTFTTSYAGNGGITRFYLGTSYNAPYAGNLGIALNYYVTGLEYSSEVLFSSNSYVSTAFDKYTNTRGLGLTFGYISNDISPLLNVEWLEDFRLGVSYDLASTSKGESTLYYVIRDVNDTVRAGDAELKIPECMNLGLSFRAGNVKYYMDYLSQPWTKLTLNGDSFSEMQDVYKISVGAEYNPKPVRGMPVEQFLWRGGVSYEKTPYVVSGNQINQLSVSVGMTYVMSYGNSLDFALIYSNRGTTDNNLIREDIIKFAVGLSLGELWFIRQER